MATNSAIWFRKNGGNWNGNPSADPATSIGGLAIDGVANGFSGPPYFAFGGVQDAFSGSGPFTFNFGASPFAFTPPTGATAWGATATLNPADKASGITLSNGNLTMAGGGEIQGAARSTTSQSTTQLFYFEATFNSTSGFVWAMGVATPSANINAGLSSDWLFPGYASIANNGAFQINNGYGTGVRQGTVGSTFGNGDVMCCAVFVQSLPGPPPPPIIPQPLQNNLFRWRGQVGLNWKGMALVGDAFTNIVGLSDFANFTEYGNTMRFSITTPPIHEDRKRIFMPRFEIEVEAGDGIAGDPTAVPQMWLEWSKDGGVTWSTLQLPQSMGLIGQYIKRLRWLNLGNARTWVFRLTCEDNVRRYVIGTYTTDYRSLG